MQVVRLSEVRSSNRVGTIGRKKREKRNSGELVFATLGTNARSGLTTFPLGVIYSDTRIINLRECGIARGGEFTHVGYGSESAHLERKTKREKVAKVRTLTILDISPFRQIFSL